MSTEPPAQSATYVPDVEETLTARDGVAIHYYEWRPFGTNPTIRGAVLLIHGFGEHLGRYGRLARAFNANGYIVGGGDHRGMGKSDGVRAFVSSHDEYVSDAATCEQRLERDLPPNSPVFVYGHSMGGLIAIMHAEHCATSHAKGTIVSAPLLGITMQVPGWRVSLGKRLLKLAPKMRNPVALEPEKLMRDPDDQELLRKDPLALKFTTLSWFFSNEKAMLWARRNIPNVSWPTLWLLPGDDRICSTPVAEAVYKMLPDFGDHTLKLYDGYFHEIHNERKPERDRVFDDALQWIEARRQQ